MTRDFIASAKGQEKRPRLYVRINALTTDLWSADLEGVMSAGPDGIILPKPRSGEDVHRLSLALDHAEERAGLKQGSTRIVAIATEVPICVLNMASFVGSSGRSKGSPGERICRQSRADRHPRPGNSRPYRLAPISACSRRFQPACSRSYGIHRLPRSGPEGGGGGCGARRFTGKLAIIGPVDHQRFHRSQRESIMRATSSRCSLSLRC